MIVALALSMLSVVGIGPPADLVDELDRAGEAEFAGRQLVVCWGADGVVAHVTDIEQSGGMTRMTSRDGSVVIGDGKMLEEDAAGMRYLEMTPGTDWQLWEGYSVSTSDDGPAMAIPGAATRVIEVSEDAFVRARFVLDADTSIPLTTQVYGANGSLYRYSTMMEVRAVLADDMMDMDDMPEPQYRERASSMTLPASAGHYRAADSYAAPGGVQVFYTDGLFRFSVFEVSRKSDGGGLADAPKAEIAGSGGYHRSFSPGSVSVFWRTADRAYLLVGDLPPDHLEAVLEDLPEPGRANILKRAWRWVFG